ncbi:hypothetical protein VKT23_002766 [Stygiomarasmius scandens]|uniref:Uncharacterized protein n=1 Tax=Marasmiellus scandens TaxID=2682957 RepID=A0ABR1K1K0_9AGAR
MRAITLSFDAVPIQTTRSPFSPTSSTLKEPPMTSSVRLEAASCHGAVDWMELLGHIRSLSARS